MKIYTRTGDTGLTGLFGGRRVWKDAPAVEAYGSVDELNAGLGVARMALGPGPLDTLLVTWGVSQVLQQLAPDVFGTAGVDVAAPTWL